MLLRDLLSEKQYVSAKWEAHLFAGRRTLDLYFRSAGNTNELQFMGARGFRVH